MTAVYHEISQPDRPATLVLMFHHGESSVIITATGLSRDELLTMALSMIE